jgi:ribosomal protein L11 methyltransferase
VTDYVLEIAVPDAPTADLVEGRLFLTAARGTTTSDAGDSLTAYFETAAERDEAAVALSDLLLKVTAGERARLDWLERYQQSLQPIAIGRRFVVAPDASLFPDDGRTRLVVPQEQAFGTGSHETTALCIELLEELDVSGTTALDVGSGSGILAMAMLRSGARRAIAFDNDPDTYGALRDNRARNGIEEASMPIFIGGIDALRIGSFGVVTMNILPEVIIPNLAAVHARMAPAGWLIASGVLIERAGEVVRAARAVDLTLCRDRTRSEWWAGLFEAGA